jgi:PAS domain S-box-containing protein
MDQEEPFAPPPPALVEILDRLAIGFYRSDLEGRIRFINPAGASIFGLSPEEMRGRYRTKDFDSETYDRQAIRQQMEECGGLATYTSRGRKADGSEVIVESSIRLLRDGGGRVVGYEGVFRDVTEEAALFRKQNALLEDLRETNERLRTLAAIQESLLSALAHDLVTPPVVMQGFVELLLRGRYGPVQSTQEKPLETIRRNVALLASMVERLLAFSRLTRHLHDRQRDSLPLGSRWREALAGGGKAAGLSAPAPQGEDDGSAVLACPESLDYLLKNLASNAASLVPEGTAIPWGVRGEGRRVALRLLLPSLADDAPPPDRILDRFYPELLAAPRDGEEEPGLGLAAARYVAVLCGGELACHPRPEGGVELVLTLPRA